MLSTLPKEMTIHFPLYDADNQRYNIRVIPEYLIFFLERNWAIVTVLNTVRLNQFP